MDAFRSVTDICASGLTAERTRMEVVANNLANAHTTRGPDGLPFRRQQVVFAAALDQARLGGGPGLGGVEVVGIEPDMSELPVVHDPGHPDADADGYVTLPNVSVPNEMMDLITASRAYEANLRALKAYRQMAENALSLLRAS